MRGRKLSHGMVVILRCDRTLRDRSWRNSSEIKTISIVFSDAIDHPRVQSKCRLFERVNAVPCAAKRERNHSQLGQPLYSRVDEGVARWLSQASSQR